MEAKCDKCNHKSIVHQKYSGMHLCGAHLKEDVERKIKRSMRKYKMIEKDDTVAVALSGGKDSMVALHVLNSLFGNRPDISIMAISIDEGIKGYRKKTIRAAKSLCKELDVPHTIVSFDESFGWTLDQIVQVRKDKFPCSFCAALKRALLNRTAQALGATKVVTGHNLDDEAQSVLMNVLRGDVDRLVRLVPTSIRPGLVPRIKPLRDVPEAEIALYAQIEHLPVDFTQCPYKGLSLRGEVECILNDFEDRHPGTMYAIMGGFYNMLGLLEEGLPQVELKQCSMCGGPTFAEICQACKLLSDLKNKKGKKERAIE